MKRNNFYIITAIILVFNFQLIASQAWKSLILPGWGEKIFNDDNKSKAHLLSDLILISSVMFTDSQYSSYRNDYRVYGSDEAGVNWYGKSDLYAAHVGNYDSMESFNSQQLLNFGPDALIYYNEFYNWDWQGDSMMRNRYDSLRNKSETYNEAKGFLIAGMLLNRIISFINVVSIERKNNINSEFSYKNDGNMNFKINYNF